MCKCRSISFLSIIEARGWGYPHIKLVYMCRPRLNKKKGGGGLTELIKLKKGVLSELKRKNGKVVPLELIEVGKNGCIQKKWVLLELINLKKGGFFCGTYPYCFNMGVHSGDCSRCLKGDGVGFRLP